MTRHTDTHSYCIMINAQCWILNRFVKQGVSEIQIIDQSRSLKGSRLKFRRKGNNSCRFWLIASLCLRFSREKQKVETHTKYCPSYWNSNETLLFENLLWTVSYPKKNSEGFQFRWLKIKGIYIAFPISITLFSNHRKWNPSQSKMAKNSPC